MCLPRARPEAISVDSDQPPYPPAGACVRMKPRIMPWGGNPLPPQGVTDVGKGLEGLIAKANMLLQRQVGAAGPLHGGTVVEARLLIA